MRTRQARLIAAAFSASAVAAGSIAVSDQAAAVGQYDCQTGYACVWVDASFGGSRLPYQIDVNSLVPYGWNDLPSSAFNRLWDGSSTRLWEHVDCTGSLSQTITFNVARATLTYNGKASSLDKYGQNTCGY